VLHVLGDVMENFFLRIAIAAVLMIGAAMLIGSIFGLATLDLWGTDVGASLGIAAIVNLVSFAIAYFVLEFLIAYRMKREGAENSWRRTGSYTVHGDQITPNSRRPSQYKAVYPTMVAYVLLCVAYTVIFHNDLSKPSIFVVTFFSFLGDLAADMRPISTFVAR
jgi:hypothetical protein